MISAARLTTFANGDRAASRLSHARTRLRRERFTGARRLPARTSRKRTEEVT